MENKQHSDKNLPEEVLDLENQQEDLEEIQLEEMESEPKKRKKKKSAGKAVLLTLLSIVAVALVLAALYLGGYLNGVLNLNVTYSGEHAGLLANEIVSRVNESGGRYAVVAQTEIPKGCVQYLLPYVDGEYIAIPNKVIEMHNGDTLFVDQIIWDRFEMHSVIPEVDAVSLMEGDTWSCGVVIEPAESFDTYLRWASSNEAVATVDQNGKVTAIGYGDAEITATGNNGTQGKIQVHVDIYPQQMNLGSEMGIAYEGDSQNLVVTVAPDYAVTDGLVWESSDTAVITVEDGVALGIKGGTAVVTATAPNGVTASITLEVQVAPTEVTMSETYLEQGRGDVITLAATVLPAEADQSNIVWASSDESIATVTQEGVVTVIAHGNVTITATTPNGVEGKCEIFSDIQFEKADLLKVSGKYNGKTGVYSITVRTNGCVNKVEFYNVGEDRIVATKRNADMSVSEKSWHFTYTTWAHGGSFHFKVIAYSEHDSDSYKWTYKSELHY